MARRFGFELAVRKERYRTATRKGAGAFLGSSYARVREPVACFSYFAANCFLVRSAFSCFMSFDF